MPQHKQRAKAMAQLLANAQQQVGGGDLQHLVGGQQYQHWQQHGQTGQGAEGLTVPNNPRQSDTEMCCLPSGCVRLQDSIHVDDPGDAVKVFCNNEGCTQGKWMHRDCFEMWQDHVLAYLRSCGRARSWSEKQRMQNLWTKKGYDLAYKACDCKCGRGHLRKDLDYIPPAVISRPDKTRKHKKRTERPAMPHLNLNKVPAQQGMMPSHQQHPAQLPQGGQAQSHVLATKTLQDTLASLSQSRPQLRVRTGSFSSTGSSGSPPSSAGSGTPPLTPGKKGGKFDFFADAAQAAAGNIFRRRTNFTAFNSLPKHQQNAYHIKMEDEGPHGNDETRCFVLTNLSTHQVTSVKCVVCCVEMPVFDQYPLIDGTFFLSPQRYNTDLQVLNDHRMLYLNAVCMKCLDGDHSGRQIRCLACRSPWMGHAFVIGSMYAYDIFAALPCCARRLTCKNCRRSILDPSAGFNFFSEYSRPIQCPHCRAEDHHFIKPLEDCFSFKATTIRKP